MKIAKTTKNIALFLLCQASLAACGVKGPPLRPIPLSAELSEAGGKGDPNLPPVPSPSPSPSRSPSGSP